MFLGTTVAGVGFGGSNGAALRRLTPLATSRERACFLSAYFVESYLAFALPAVAAGRAAAPIDFRRKAHMSRRNWRDPGKSAPSMASDDRAEAHLSGGRNRRKFRSGSSQAYGTD